MNGELMAKRRIRHPCLAAEVKSRFSGDIARVLDRLASQCGAPKYLMPGRSIFFTRQRFLPGRCQRHTFACSTSMALTMWRLP
jgi:hypothetical protein